MLVISNILEGKTMIIPLTKLKIGQKSKFLAKLLTKSKVQTKIIPLKKFKILLKRN